MYVGNRYTVTMQGARWKPVLCEHCGSEWAYKVTSKAVGTGRSPYFLDNDGAKQRARDSAVAQMERMLANLTREIACPDCGKYQAAMAEKLKGKAFPGLQALGICLIGAPLLVILVIQELVPIQYGLIGWAVSAVLGIAALFKRRQLQRELDVNRDAQKRAKRDLSTERDVILRAQYEAFYEAAASVGRQHELAKIDWTRKAA